MVLVKKVQNVTVKGGRYCEVITWTMQSTTKKSDTSYLTDLSYKLEHSMTESFRMLSIRTPNLLINITRISEFKFPNFKLQSSLYSGSSFKKLPEFYSRQCFN